MAETTSTTGGIQRTLGLTGVTMNAMALIAPGAFLWITIQLQAANAGGDTDMWTGIVVALIIALLTAFSFAELARRYPDAGTGGSYYFAEKAFLDRDEPRHQRFARIAKFITGWAAHLFYWVYPGVMVSFMALLITYILSQFGIALPYRSRHAGDEPGDHRRRDDEGEPHAEQVQARGAFGIGNRQRQIGHHQQRIGADRKRRDQHHRPQRQHQRRHRHRRQQQRDERIAASVLGQRPLST